MGLCLAARLAANCEKHVLFIPKWLFSCYCCITLKETNHIATFCFASSLLLTKAERYTRLRRLLQSAAECAATNQQKWESASTPWGQKIIPSQQKLKLHSNEFKWLMTESKTTLQLPSNTRAPGVAAIVEAQSDFNLAKHSCPSCITKTTPA